MAKRKPISNPSSINTSYTHLQKAFESLRGAQKVPGYSKRLEKKIAHALVYTARAGILVEEILGIRE